MPISAFPLLNPSPRVSIPSAFTNEAQLLQHLGMSASELRVIRRYRYRMYRAFDVRKRGGATRIINAPDQRLKMLQRKIAELLDTIYRPRSGVHGFVRHRSVKTNAEAHLRKRFIINLDLAGFFPTITEARVSGLLTALGIDLTVSEAIAGICCLGGALPQGAPTSPVISNMICFRLDKRLQAIAKAQRCIYTRYADDITFSSYQPPVGMFDPLPPAGKFSPELLSTEVKSAFAENGFELHPDKCHYSDRHSRKTVTGLRVNELVNVDRRYIRNIRAALYAIEKSGSATQQAVLNGKYGNPVGLVPHLQGRVAWVGHIKGRADPTFRGLAERFNKLFPNSKLDVLPNADEMRDRSIWLVEHEGNSGTQGTAFFLKGVGLVTANHCVEGIEEAEVYHPSKPANKFKVGVLKSDPDRDLAILSHGISDTEFYELELSYRTFHSGDIVTAYGYPDFGPGDKISIRHGAISSLPVKHGLALIEVSQKLAQGMSGGPLLDIDGLVAGIIHRGGPEQVKDLAVHKDALSAWLAPTTP